MHSFVQLIVQLFSKAITPALIGAGIGVLAVVLLARRRRKQGQRLAVARGAAIVLLPCYLAGLAALTLLMRTNGGVIQTHMFRAFWEAWNSFTLQSWLNPLLNVAMFMPLGVLLPLAVPSFCRWHRALAAGLGLSLLIDPLQHVLQRGSADVDDLFCNTLGTMLGWCLSMLAANLAQKKWTAAGSCAVLPALSAAFLIGVFVVYQCQPYGNLADAPAFAANTSGTKWVLECGLSDQPGKTGIYWVEPFTKESCDEFAVEFLGRLGAEISFDSLDVNYYDNTTAYSDNSTYSLWVDHNDRSYKYTDFRVDSELWGKAGAATEEELRTDLGKLGIKVPESTEFIEERKGQYLFRANRVEHSGTLTDGELRCRVVEGGILFEVDNALTVSALLREVPVISQREAYEQLRRGRFSRADMFEFYAPEEVHVTSCQLQYLIDTKGFRQPVYVFYLDELNTAVYVPALSA